MMLPKRGLDTVIPRDGKIFSAFYKRRTDGKARFIVARTGVKKGVTGEGMRYVPQDRDLLPVWDMTKGAFRMINLNGLVVVRSKGRVYVADTI